MVPIFFLTSNPKFSRMNRIAYLLRKSGRSQAFLGRELSKSKTTIHNWCSNVTQPSIIEGAAIAKLLGCTLEDLIEKEHEEHETEYAKRAS